MAKKKTEYLNRFIGQKEDVEVLDYAKKKDKSKNE
jgi:hypothetical protein